VRKPLELPSSPLITTRLASLIGADAEGYLSRMDVLRRTRHDLSTAEISALYQFMDGYAPPRDINAEEYHALRNELLNLLRDQTPFPQHLATNLMIMYHDQRHGSVWRDYCIQHLAQTYSETSSAKQPAVRGTLWEATAETGSTIAGTALIGLARNVDHPDFSRDQIARKALQYATDSAMDDMTRLTAIQVCVLLNDRGVLSVSRELAASNVLVPLRMSAIAAIGSLGDPSDRNLLSQYAAASDVRLRTAAISALKRLPDGG